MKTTKKDRPILFRVEPELDRRIRVEAARRGYRTLSDFLGDVVREAIKRRPRQTDEARC
jgi:hypothetical protein